MAKKNASKEGIRLAEEGDWAQLLTCLLAKPAIAQQRDHYGMLPLHWACTENDVPINVLLALIEAYPDAAMAKNDAQMLPLHVAIRSNVGPSALSILCAASPDSIWTKLPDGLRPLAMATMSGLDQESLGVLQKAEEQYRWTHPDVEDDDDDAAQYEETKRDLLRQSQLMRDSLRDSQLFNSIVLDHKHSCESSPMGIEEVEEESSSNELADVTKRTSSASSASSARHSSGGCHVCHKSFSVFRKKYVCCSCHVCVCKHHIAGRRFGSESSKAVLCADCVGKDQPQAEPTPERRLQTQRSSTFLSSPEAASTPPKPRNYSSEAPTPPPSMRRRSASSRGEMEAMDKDILMRRIIGARGSGSDTASCTGSEQEPSDVSALSLQVRLLEARNASLELRVFEQEKQHNEAMLLLTQTMTRLAELEMKMSMQPSSGNSFSSVENGVLDFHNPFTEHFSSS